MKGAIVHLTEYYNPNPIPSPQGNATMLHVLVHMLTRYIKSHCEFWCQCTPHLGLFVCLFEFLFWLCFFHFSLCLCVSVCLSVCLSVCVFVYGVDVLTMKFWTRPIQEHSSKVFNNHVKKKERMREREERLKSLPNFLLVLTQPTMTATTCFVLCPMTAPQCMYTAEFYNLIANHKNKKSVLG